MTSNKSWFRSFILSREHRLMVRTEQNRTEQNGTMRKIFGLKIEKGKGECEEHREYLPPFTFFQNPRFNAQCNNKSCFLCLSRVDSSVKTETFHCRQHYNRHVPNSTLSMSMLTG